jgi:hypothetical protein
VKLSVLPGGKGSGKTDSDGPNRKNQPTGLITSFVFLFQLKTETHTVLEMCFFLSWNAGQCPQYYNTPLSECCKARVYKCSNCLGAVSKILASEEGHEMTSIVRIPKCYTLSYKIYLFVVTWLLGFVHPCCKMFILPLFFIGCVSITVFFILSYDVLLLLTYVASGKNFVNFQLLR